MEKNNPLTIMVENNKRLIAILFGATCLLFIPLIAMQFSDKVIWTSFDFIIAAILVISASLIFEFALRKIKALKTRILVCAVLFLLYLLTWTEMEVGIFGTPIAGN